MRSRDRTASCRAIEPQSRGLDHGHIVLGHATKVEKAFARFFVDGLPLCGGAWAWFRRRYNKALWNQRRYQGPGQAERAARYLSKYVSKERGADWLREKAGQRVFYVAPWLCPLPAHQCGSLGLVAGSAAKHGYCERPRCRDEELEAVTKFLAVPRWTSREDSLGRGGRALDPAGSSRPRALVSGVHETVEGSFSMAHTQVPSTRTQKGVVGCVMPSLAAGHESYARVFGNVPRRHRSLERS